MQLVMGLKDYMSRVTKEGIEQCVTVVLQTADRDWSRSRRHAPLEQSGDVGATH